MVEEGKSEMEPVANRIRPQPLTASEKKFGEYRIRGIIVALHLLHRVLLRMWISERQRCEHLYMKEHPAIGQRRERKVKKK